MRTLEIRRHTHRNVPQPHLSQIGVDLARRAGDGLGKFDRVVTSTIPRAFETAIAMGYAVDEQLEQLGMMSEAVTAVIQWNAGFTAWAKTTHSDPVVAHYAQMMADVLRSIVRTLPEEGRALIISHGGIVEACVVGCVPATMHFADDAACGYCEGARLTFSGETATHFEMLRVEQPR
ncbi:MAG TPA: phosphoglycerate mutase family protein [Anaerolineae bacterium]|nr:phosphoglycerate mutase family protein [Anaerolineae bacterium]